MTGLKVLIVGAGVAGSAVAFWLARLGHDVTVVEQHPALRVNGLQIDLRGRGIEVIKLMGLEEAVRAECVPEKGIELVDSTGRRRAFFPANTSGQGAQSFSSEFEIMRGDLCQILHDSAVERGAKYRFGVSITSYDDEYDSSAPGASSSRVKVKLTDNTTGTFDLVVGCDGLSSKTRRLMLQGSRQRAESLATEDSSLTTLPERIAYFTMSKPIQKGEEYIASGRMMTDKRMLLFRRHRDDRIQVYLTADTKSGSGQLAEVARGDVVAEKAAFAELYAGGGWRADEVVQALHEDADDFYCQQTGFVKIDSWSRGRMTLVGDAAAGTPPDGTGTSMALVGAYVLCGEIANACSHNTENGHGGSCLTTTAGDGVFPALKAYEDIFYPYMKKHHGSYSSEPGIFDKIPWNNFTIGIFTYVMSVASSLRLDKLAFYFSSLYGSDGWDMPTYDSMVKT